MALKIAPDSTRHYLSKVSAPLQVLVLNLLQSISVFLSLAIVGAFAGLTDQGLNDTVATSHDGGWNELLHSEGLFDSNLNIIQLKSADDSVLLGQLSDLLGEESVLEKVYFKYRVNFKTSYDPAPSPSSVQVFKQQLLNIAAHNLEANSGKHSWWKGVNQFTDMTRLELQKELNHGNEYDSVNTNTSASAYVPSLPSLSSGPAAPAAFSWLDMLKVTPARDVRSGPSPAMFAAVSAIETMFHMVTNKGQGGVISLSEQIILDCFQEYCAQRGSNCIGTEIDGILKYVGFNCMASLGQYPYNDPPGKGTCRDEQRMACLDSKFPYNLFSGTSDDQLKDVISKNGPLIVEIYVSVGLMNEYSKGVYPGTECGSNPPNRLVTLVGYGNDGQGDYWLIKNSWGAKWGIQGFLKLARNGSNVCGIQTSAYLVRMR